MIEERDIALKDVERLNACIDELHTEIFDLHYEIGDLENQIEYDRL
jgi:hypothetical protein